MSKLSIVTINRNNAEGLQKTIESVICQTYTDFEFIIIDGASTDASLDVIHKNISSITYWISEPDSGVYNAMNKGVNQAKGEYLLMLNAGDELIDESVLSNVFNAEITEDIVYGNVLWLENNGCYESTFPDKPQFSFFYKYSIGHQAAFVKKSLHETVGLYIETNRIVSDWCFFIKAFCHFNCTFKHIPFIISKCDRDGISCNPDYFPLIEKERKDFLNNEFPCFVDDYENAEQLKIELNDLKKLYYKKGWIERKYIQFKLIIKRGIKHN